MEKSLNCLRCQGQMGPGFVLNSEGAPMVHCHWVHRPAQPSGWGGADLTKEALQIEIYRCKACGYLEPYARKDG